MTIDDVPMIETSPLSGRLTHDGVTVDVQIYRIAGTTDRWILEVVDEHDASTVWNHDFASDRDAYSEFYRTLETEGVGAFVETPTLSTKH